MEAGIGNGGLVVVQVYPKQESKRRQTQQAVGCCNKWVFAVQEPLSFPHFLFFPLHLHAQPS